MSITIQRRVTIKTRVTENWKRRKVSEIQDSLKALEGDLGRLEQETKKTRELKDPKKSELLGRSIALEKQKRAEQKEALLQRMKEIIKLEPGTEVLEGALEGPVEVKEGDDWVQVMSAELVLEDGMVVSIKEGTG